MKQIKSDWTDVVLVCRKCAKKLKGGFGPDGDLSLPKALRAEVARRDGASKPLRKPRRKGASVAIIEVNCLDVCPKNGAVVIGARTPGRWRVIAPGEDAGALLDELAPPKG